MLLLNLPPFTSLHESDRSGWQGWLTHVVHEVPFEVVLGAENRDAYLARRVPSYRVWQYINTNLAPDALVLTFSGGDHFYSHRPRLSADATLAHAAVWGASPENESQALTRLNRAGGHPYPV